MKLATLKNKSRDGQLVVVDRDLKTCVAVHQIAKSMQEALENWSDVEGELHKIYQKLNNKSISDPIDFNPSEAMAPLPRAYQWLDSSTYFPHIQLMAKISGLEVKDNPREVVRMFQGASDQFIGCHDPFYATTDEMEIDFEAEVGVITDDVPLGVSEEQARKHIKLICFLNDFSVRDLQRQELLIRFGFIQGKPATSFSPVAVTPDEFGEAWDGQRLHATLNSTLRGKLVGWTKTGQDMAFSFSELVAHAARTRALTAGTVLGSGTVSNAGYQNGSSCISEIRALEHINGQPEQTGFMKFGDRIQISLSDKKGHKVLGEIDQTVEKA